MALPIIQVSRGEWGSHNWTLDAYGKQFFLGQDGKFCSRVLGMRSSQVVEYIGSNDLRQDKVRRKLARFIINQLELDKKKLMAIEPWGLCCQ